MLQYSWTIPVYTVSEANTNQHWAKKKKRTDLQKRWIWLIFKRDKPDIKLPCLIKLIRIGKRKLDDDNLPVSVKILRDKIADQIIPGKAAGQADSDSRLSWEYAQEKGENSVRIEIYSIDSVL
jgi:hypothetical protein